ncbi:MAG: Tetratricopeptide repeat-containing protein, partial [Tardiphaga sp.]|nr:Tetratricopeptide repeat-containing protein [Tardiphaga sp.]
MRSFVSPFAASAVLAVAVLTSIGASAQTAVDPPVACAALTVTASAQLIESCTALIDNPATPDADRLDATITRAVAFHGNGQTAKA